MLHPGHLSNEMASWLGPGRIVLPVAACGPGPACSRATSLRGFNWMRRRNDVERHVPETGPKAHRTSPRSVIETTPSSNAIVGFLTYLAIRKSPCTSSSTAEPHVLGLPAEYLHLVPQGSMAQCPGGRTDDDHDTAGSGMCCAWPPVAFHARHPPSRTAVAQ